MQLAKRQLAVAVASALFQPGFVWDLSKGSIVPARGATWANVTHTRATIATVDDQDSIVRNVLSGEARFRGLRRVQNLLTFSEDFSNGVWNTGDAGNPILPNTTDVAAPDGTFTACKWVLNTNATNRSWGYGGGVATTALPGRTYAFSFWVYIPSTNSAGPFSAYMFNAAEIPGDQISLNALPRNQWVRVRYVHTWGGGATTNIIPQFHGNFGETLGDRMYVWRPQLEELTGQAVPVPGEYQSVSRLAAPYQGANVDGVKYLPTHNGNVVQQNLFINAATMSGWNSAGVTQTPAQTDPFGGTTASLFTVTDNAGSRSFAQAVAGLTSGQVFTAAVWVKAVNKLTCNIGLYDGTSFYTPISFAVVQGPGNIVDPGAHNLSVTGLSTTQWSKIVITVMCSSAGAVDLFCYPGSAGAEQGTSILAAQPQLQPGRRAGTWVSTAAVAINNNIVEEAVGDTISGNPGYLREDSRANLILQSEDFATTWTVSAATVSVNQTVAPDGTTNADKILDTAANANHDISQAVAKAASALAYTYTVYAKAGTKTSVLLQGAEGTNGAFASFNLSTGAVIDVAQGFGAAPFTAMSHAITALPNGWYRCELRFTTGTGVSLSMTNRITNAAYLGDGLGTIFLWGAQLEQATCSASYIPTTTVAVTRNTDVLLCSGLGGYFTADGTWYAESVADQTSIINPRVVGLTNPKSPLTHNTGVTPAGQGTYQASMWDGAVSFSSANVASTGALAKMCSKYTVGANAGGVCLNGGAVNTGNTNAYSGETTIAIGTTNAGGATGFYGVVRKVQAWPRRLPDAYMQRITT